MITQVPGDGQSLPLAAVGFKQDRAVRFAEPQVIPARIADVFQFQPQLSVGIPDRILPIVVHPGQGKALLHGHGKGHVGPRGHLPGVFFDLTAFRLHKANGDGLFFGSFPGTAGEQQRCQHCQGQNSLHRAHLPTIPVNSIALPVSQGKKDVPNGQFFATNRSFSARTAQKSERTAKPPEKIPPAAEILLLSHMISELLLCISSRYWLRTSWTRRRDRGMRSPLVSTASSSSNRRMNL